MKIRTMLLLSAMLFAILPMIIYSVFASTMLNTDGDKEFQQGILEIVNNERQTLTAYIDTVNSQLDMITNEADVKKALSDRKANDAASNFLIELVNSNKNIESVALVDADGNIFCGSAGRIGKTVENFPAYSEYADNALYYNAVKNPEATGGGTNPTMFIKRTVGQATVMINYKLSDKGFLYEASGGSTYYNGQVTVVDSKMRYNIVDNFKVNLYYEYPAEVFKSAIDSLTDDSAPFILRYTPANNTGGGEYYAAMVKVGGENGLIAIANCPVKGNSNYFSLPAGNSIVLAVILISIVVVAGSIVCAVLVTKPLQTIEETLVKVRRGDHEARIPTAVSNNEYGQMSRAFNNLLDEIVVSEDRYRTITEMSDNIIFEWNFKTNEVFFSNNFNKKFSYRAPSDHFGDSFLLKAKLHEEDSERYKADLEKLGRGEEFKHNEYRMKNIYGDYIWVLMRTATLHDKDGNPLKIVGVILDIDRAKKSEQQLTERASFDALTELYNRETIESQIDNEITLSEARKSEMAVLFIDVDDFKHYNDQYSHATGDQVLKFVARTIKGVVSEFGFAGRYGGDEFIVCVRNAEINDPTRVAQDIINRLDEGFDCDGEHLTVSVSIGISMIKDDYNTRVEYIIGKADDAMYSVKKNGKSNYAFI